MNLTRLAREATSFFEWFPAIRGFRTPEISGEQLVLWERRLEDALPDDHQVRHLDFLLGSEAFADTLPEMELS